jgi:hypothetical protein
MAWRAAHGASRRGGRLVAIETLPADEQPSASAKRDVGKHAPPVLRLAALG